MIGDEAINRMILTAAVAACLAAAVSTGAASASSSSTVAEARREVWRLFGPVHAPRMLCVIGRESGWNPNAINWRDYHRGAGHGSFGLAQIGRLWIVAWLRDRWRLALDPVLNVRLAFRVFRIQGFRAWTASRWC